MNKILIVSDCPTHPVVGGNRMCILQYIRILKEMSYDPYFLFIDLKTSSENDKIKTLDYWGIKYFTYSLPKIQYIVQRIGSKITNNHNIDNIDLYCPWGAVSYINKLNRHYKFHGIIVNYIWLSKLLDVEIPKKILFTHDVFSFRNERVKNAFWYDFSPNQEAKALNRCINICSIQKIESLYFSFLAPKSNIFTVYSAFDFKDIPINNNNNILFFSGGGALNINGIKNFIENVFYSLIDIEPNYKLIIGGKICDYLKDDYNDDRIIFKGLYDDPKEFYQLGDVVINPVSEGTGLKIKTIEAISYGRVTIGNEHSLIGVYDKKNFPFIVANTKEEYIKYISRYCKNRDLLLKNKEKCIKYISDLNRYVTLQFYNILNK